MAKIAVIIVNFNAGELLGKCLLALRRQTFRSFRVIVVDNASSDDSVSHAQLNFPEVEFVLLPSNLGFAAGNNVGINKATDCDWIACLNADAFPEPEWLENLLRASLCYPDFAFFGSMMVSFDNPEQFDGTADIYHVSGLAWRRDHRVSRANGHAKVGEIFGPCAAAAMYQREALVEVGGFDEKFFCYFEDVDLAFRLRLKGYRCLYVPDAVVSHMGSAITGYQSDFTVYHGHRNLEWAYFKNMPLSLLVRYLPQHLMFNLASFFLYVFRGKVRTLFKAKWHAILGLPAVLNERRTIQKSRRVASSDLLKVMARGVFTPYGRN